MTLSHHFRKPAFNEPTAPQPVDSPTLLVVDDEPQITLALAEQFRGKYRVMTASSGEQALGMLKTQRVDVIIADQRMPGMGGSEMLACACQAAPDSVRILLTGYADLNSVVEGVNQGKIFYFLSKPWRNQELETIIDRAVEHGRLIQHNRQLVEELRRANAELEDRVRLRTAELEARTRELELAHQQCAELARRDPLTNLANRRWFDETLQREAERGARNQMAISLILLDLDHFKTVNDRFGHPVGDQVLMATAEFLAAHARPYDLVVRYGGEEFLILLPGIEQPQALEIAERIRLGLSDLRVSGGPASFTASFGVATLAPGQPPGELLPRADAALYLAKKNGRNRVEADPNSGV